MKPFIAGGLFRLFAGIAAMTPLILPGAETAKEENEMPARLFTVRDGMPNLAAKLAAGKPVTVVFLGGSITVMGSYTQVGYVSYVGKWLRERYPGASIRIRNAGVPGTGSDYGAKRYDRDVLRHNPDAVFVEFAVNDGTTDRTREMERIVHKTWQKNPGTDLVFFYTLDKSHLKDYQAGRLPFAAACHERVAEFYGIPTIGTAFLAAGKIQSGEIPWKTFSGDTCHPSAAGFRIFDEAFASALPELLRPNAGFQHKLGRSITPNLEVYPPRLKAKPLPQASFPLAKGEAAAFYPLPVPAEHWVEGPVYKTQDGKTLWSIHLLPRSAAGKLDGTAGIDRSLWAEKFAEWFEEGHCFSGTDGMSVFSGAEKTSPVLGMGGKEVAVLCFTAPESGDYVFRVRSGPFRMWANDGSTVAFGVLKFSGKQNAGEKLALHREIRKEERGVSMEFETRLEKGDQVAFVPDLKLPNYIRGGWHRLQITAALRKAAGK